MHVSHHDHIRTIVILIWDLINYFYLLVGQCLFKSTPCYSELGKLEAVVVVLHE